jgi:zona occludens toxin (predicted ATPase)
MNKRILVLLTVVPLMVLMVFFVATAAIAQGEHGRENACGKIQQTPASGKAQACLTT